MDQTRWIKLIIIMTLIALSTGRELRINRKHHLEAYDHTLAIVLAEYASAVYMSDLTELFTWTCSRCDGMTEGFEVIEIIVDIEHCLQAFVGFADNLNAIIIAFRGTQGNSIQNWIEDLYWKQLDLNYPGMPDAMVHHGFYASYHNTTVRSGVLNAVKRSKRLYGNVDIMVTGHSMGGAMAAFCALDLRVNHEARNVHVVTFGQPRIGNADFASYYSELVPNTIRITNEHDIVPHLPPYYSHFVEKTYHHFPREVWLHNIDYGSLIYKIETICDDSGEDPSCSRSVVGNSISDHLNYYGIKMGGDEYRTCKIVFDSKISTSGLLMQEDVNGNLILSRNSTASSSVIEMKMKTRYVHES
ncbi:lipase-like [Impatiens glandulifera]|uniref:lipase-like n=1 Tax=Impatiens glandulifera TaxID=253017 RepID=UPI001FB13B8D|nr:lipase-like [Impatiens glandulifera]